MPNIRITLPVTPPGPLGTTKGGHVYAEIPEQSSTVGASIGAGATIGDGSVIKDNYQPIDCGRFPYAASSQPWVVTVGTALNNKVSNDIRVYVSPYSDDEDKPLVRFGLPGATPSVVVTVPATLAAKPQSGANVTPLLVTGVSATVGTAVDVGGKLKRPITVTVDLSGLSTPLPNRWGYQLLGFQDNDLTQSPVVASGIFNLAGVVPAGPDGITDLHTFGPDEPSGLMDITIYAVAGVLAGERYVPGLPAHTPGEFIPNKIVPHITASCEVQIGTTGYTIPPIAAPSREGMEISVTIVPGPTTPGGIETYGWDGSLTLPDLTFYMGCELTIQHPGQDEGPFGKLDDVTTMFHNGYFPRPPADEVGVVFRAYPVNKDGVRGDPAAVSTTIGAHAKNTLQLTEADPATVTGPLQGGGGHPLTVVPGSINDTYLAVGAVTEKTLGVHAITAASSALAANSIVDSNVNDVGLVKVTYGKVVFAGDVVMSRGKGLPVIVLKNDGLTLFSAADTIDAKGGILTKPYVQIESSGLGLFSGSDASAFITAGGLTLWSVTGNQFLPYVTLTALGMDIQQRVYDVGSSGSYHTNAVSVNSLGVSISGPGGAKLSLGSDGVSITQGAGKFIATANDLQLVNGSSSVVVAATGVTINNGILNAPSLSLITPTVTNGGLRFVINPLDGFKMDIKDRKDYCRLYMSGLSLVDSGGNTSDYSNGGINLHHTSFGNTQLTPFGLSMPGGAGVQIGGSLVLREQQAGPGNPNFSGTFGWVFAQFWCQSLLNALRFHGLVT